MRPTRQLRLETVSLPEPPTRGALLSARVVAERLNAMAPELRITPRWVKDHVRPRVKLSAHKFGWYERDFEQWVESRRETA